MHSCAPVGRYQCAAIRREYDRQSASASRPRERQVPVVAGTWPTDRPIENVLDVRR
jgi:hypothetical protein